MYTESGSGVTVVFHQLSSQSRSLGRSDSDFEVGVGNLSRVGEKVKSNRFRTQNRSERGAEMYVRIGS